MAKIKYRILSVNPDEHSVVVRYFSDSHSEIDLAQHDGYGNIEVTKDGYPLHCRTDYNINIWNVDATEAEVHQQISRSAPRDWFTMQEKIKLTKGKSTAMNYLFKKLGKVIEIAELPPPKPLK